MTSQLLSAAKPLRPVWRNETAVRYRCQRDMVEHGVGIRKP